MKCKKNNNSPRRKSQPAVNTNGTPNVPESSLGKKFINSIVVNLLHYTNAKKVNIFIHWFQMELTFLNNQLGIPVLSMSRS